MKQIYLLAFALCIGCLHLVAQDREVTITTIHFNDGEMVEDSRTVTVDADEDIENVLNDLEEKEELDFDFDHDFSLEGPSCHKKLKSCEKGSFGASHDDTPFMGIVMNSSDNDAKIEGVYISDVIDGSSADKGGMEAGDILISMNGQRVYSIGGISEQLEGKVIGDNLRVSVIRAGEQHSYNLNLQAEALTKASCCSAETAKNCCSKAKSCDAGAGTDPAKAFLGAYLNEMLEDDNGTKTTQLIIEKVMEHGTASEAGFQAGDQILMANGGLANSFDAYGKAMENVQAGDKVNFIVFRNGAKVSITAKMKNAGSTPGVVLHGPRGLYEVKMMDGKMQEIPFEKHHKQHLKRKHVDHNPNRAFMGVYLETEIENENGSESFRMTIGKVINGGAAEEAGLQSGDEIIGVENGGIDQVKRIHDILDSKKPGDQLRLQVRRNNQQLEKVLTLKAAKETPMHEEGINIEIDIDEEDNGSERSVKVIHMGDGEFDKLMNGGEFEFEIDDDNGELKRMVIRSNNDFGDCPDLKVLVIDMTRDEVAKWQPEGESFTDFENLSVKNFRIAPNPNAGRFELNFTLEDKAPTEVRIMNSTCKIIFQEDLGEFEGNLSKHIDMGAEKVTGLFIVQIIRPGLVMSRKMIIE